MFPMVVKRAPPTGHLFVSSLFDKRCSRQSKRLLMGSKTESTAVAKNDKDNEETAA